MLAMKCARCGAPVPLSLAEPDRTRCAYCNHEEPPPPAISERLQRAAEALRRHAISERQLRGVVGLTVRYGGLGE